MPLTLTASDRKSLVRLASTLPVGSPERKAILAGLAKTKVSSRKTAGAHPLGPMSTVYFSLVVEEWKIEDDADEGSRSAERLLDDPSKIQGLEDKALKNLSRMFGKEITKVKRGVGQGLTCKFSVGTYEDVLKMAQAIRKHHISDGDDEDEVNPGVKYLYAVDFRLYPNGKKGRSVFYGYDPRAKGDLNDWLSEHK